MKRQDILTLVTTFLVGAIAGGYVYVTGFKPQFEEFTGQTAEVYEDLVLVGEQYGGDVQGTLPSFQLLSNGTFTYIPATPSTATVEPKQGTVPRGIWNDIVRAVDADTLYSNAELITVTDCSSFVDGIDYRYEITLDSVVYNLDTCGTDFTSTEIRQALDKLWKYFATLE